MDSAIVRATLQSAALSALSNIISQAITYYRSNGKKSFNLNDLVIFVLFSALACPPNYIWQAWLERNFPANSTPALVSNDKKSLEQPRLNKRNTACKFALDMTLGASGNTALFLLGTSLLRNGSVDLAVASCREKFWPVMQAGWRLWPMVSLLNFSVVPFQWRMTLGNVVGLFWGVWMSFVSRGN